MDMYEKEALNYVNEIRVREGCPPLEELCSGLQRDSARCPIARSLEDCVASPAAYGTFIRYWTRRGELIRRGTPMIVAHFINRFDGGWYPDLVASDEATTA